MDLQFTREFNFELKYRCEDIINEAYNSVVLIEDVNKEFVPIHNKNQRQNHMKWRVLRLSLIIGLIV